MIDVSALNTSMLLLDAWAGMETGMANLVLRRIVASLGAGAITIALNMAALWSADLVHLPTAHGGLLKLLVQLTGLPLPHDGTFKAAFHVVVGLTMALVYGLFLEPQWRASAFTLGLTYAAVVWVVNAFVVLPVVGEGIAGSATLNAPGILWFAVAHTIFFVALSFLYQRVGLANREATVVGNRFLCPDRPVCCTPSNSVPSGKSDCR
jgi:hypothetical protein